MQNDTPLDTTGLKAILNHNEITQPNDDLLNTLKAYFPQFFDKDGNFRSDKFDDELKKNNITESRDGYKLGFVGKDYARLQVGLESETMIVPDCKHNTLPENTNSGNVFITGDNIDALRHLVNAYENQIKLIYIDPPYNTGKEFTYNDEFEFSDEKLESALGYTNKEIARLKTIQGKSSHSAWLTFMYPRLKIAQRLLKDDGVIFVSIDDNEQANLKLLMDDVFGEGNFVGTFPWRKRTTKSDVPFGVSQDYEWILGYTKTNSVILGLSFERKYYESNDYPNNRWRLSDLTTQKTESQRPNSVFDLVDPKTGKVYKYNPKRLWGITKDTFQDYYDKGKIVFPDDYPFLNLSIPAYRVFESEDKEKALRKYGTDITVKTISTHFPIEVGRNENGNKECDSLLGNKIFSFPKPTSLIEYLMSSVTTKSMKEHDLILDFFAGSATTAHAVMQLNAEDGGNRKFIMVQLDEQTNSDSEARKAGYNTIDEIARDRICRAGKKILTEYEGDLVKQTNGWDKDVGFKHYRLITPDVKTLENIVEFKPEETNLIADDMIKPFEYKETNTSGLDTILTTWLIDAGYRFDTLIEEITFGNYKAHYVRSAVTIYLINRDWDTAALKDLLNQIGTNRLLVKTIVVYPYSFAFEAMRELKTNIKTNLDNPPNLIERF
jgi:adenine specific DNA methylase Mod